MGTAAVGVSSLSLPRFTTALAAIVVPGVGTVADEIRRWKAKG